MAENLPDTNVGNIEYTSKEDASDAVIKYLQLDYAYAWGVREAINSLPSADVAPVVHSRWVLGGYDDMYYVCEKCRHKQSEYYVKPTANFCPNCGAKMDKGD